VAFRISGSAEYEADLEAAAGGGGVVGFEPWTAVEILCPAALCAHQF
jgi:hypothetical protein